MTTPLTSSHLPGLDLKPIIPEHQVAVAGFGFGQEYAKHYI